MTESLGTGQVRRTWNSFSCKVGGTLEENLFSDQVAHRVVFISRSSYHM